MLKEDTADPDKLYKEPGESYLHNGCKAKEHYVDIMNSRIQKTLFESGSVTRPWQREVLVHLIAKQRFVWL